MSCPKTGLEIHEAHGSEDTRYHSTPVTGKTRSHSVQNENWRIMNPNHIRYELLWSSLWCDGIFILSWLVRPAMNVIHSTSCLYLLPFIVRIDCSNRIAFNGSNKDINYSFNIGTVCHVIWLKIEIQNKMLTSRLKNT